MFNRRSAPSRHAAAMRIWKTLLAAGALALAGATAPPRVANSVPIERAWLGLIQAPVTLNGAVEARFIVDTAATETVMSDATIARLGLAGSGEPARVHGATGSNDLNYYRLGSLRIGDAVFRDIGAYDLPPLYAEIGADGLIGADILRRHVVEFDLPAGAMRLHPRGARLAGEWTTAPLLQRRDGFLLTEVRVGSLTMPALVDTGAVHNFINRAAARRLGIALDPDAFEQIAGASGHVQTMARTELAGFAIGEAAFGPSRLGVVDLAIFETLGLDRGPAMILSAESLGKRRFVIDYPRSRLLIEQ